MKIGAEYDEHNRSAEVARDLFLRAVQKCEPRVLADLRERPFAAFQTNDPHPLPEAYNLMPDLRSDPRPDRFGTFPFRWEEWNLRAETRTLLQEWAARWHLTAPWCLERAAYTMLLWRNKPRVAGRQWARAGRRPRVRVGGLTADERIFEFREYGGDPTAEPWIKAKKRLRKGFESALRRFRERQERLMTTRGLHPAPTKNELLHFKWLARYQVQECSYEASGAGYVSDRKTVELAIKGVAKIVGLTLRRRGQRGRPRGIKEDLPRRSRS